MNTGTQAYIDEQTGIRLTVVYDITEYPLVTVYPPETNTLSLEQMNDGVRRLLAQAGIKPGQAPGGSP